MGETLGLDLASKKQRLRKDYAYRLDYRTRWADNDMFHHLNNPIYGVLIDSIINDFLIKKCGYNTHSYPRTALVASTYCDYFGSVAYPNMLDVGLRVVKLGNNSVTYECGIFEEEQEQVKAVGGFTQILPCIVLRHLLTRNPFMEGVKREDNRSPPEGLEPHVRSALTRLMSGSGDQKQAPKL
ncbi:hypothetical protein LTS00_016645 [Friedmanniomyces endolithicus]|uniref:Thioesterase domain-containing protein n=1 Tax=Friedmanniomyces endolithicus TaxID=329885 RepID=A0AAN6J7B9_9PEZI|nr:hypothetical protein LTS00_016645 [Friedmanniomyces endolithicus]KAK0319996.1 hypothetical protein LTR82_008931 [Friedmanniomyces endolithicus]